MMYFILVIFLIVFFGSHWIAYRLIAKAISVSKPRIIFWLRAIIIILSFSFVGTTILMHFWDNAITRFFYFLAGIWVGILINLVMAFIFCSIVYLIFRLLKKEYNGRALARISLLVVILVVLVGLINVFILGVKEVDVTIKDLPENWQNKKIVQISDLHLGSILGKSFLQNVVLTVNDLEPDLIVITGDLFDGSDGFEVSMVPLLSEFKAKRGVYYITGNQEIYLGVDEILTVMNESEVVVLDDEVINLDGLQLIGYSYPRINEQKVVPQSILDNYDSGLPSILLYHLPNDIGESSNSRSNIYFTPDTDFETAKEMGIDLQLSGHTHNGQIFPFNLLTSLLYSNFDNGLRADGDFQIYTNAGTGVWGPTLRTSGRPEITLITLH